MNVRCISSFKEVLLVVDLRVFAQRAFVGKGEDLLEDIHLPQDLAQAVNPHGFFVLHDGFLQVSFACKGAERSQPEWSGAAPLPFPLRSLGCPRMTAAFGAVSPDVTQGQPSHVRSLPGVQRALNGVGPSRQLKSPR